ncbi:MAG: hypothetical protein ABIK61_03515 [candidate division WOR-3 bacterium]
MSKIEEILQLKVKPKEKITLLANEIKRNKKFVDEIIEYFESTSAGNQGHLIEFWNMPQKKNQNLSSRILIL